MYHDTISNFETDKDREENTNAIKHIKHINKYLKIVKQDTVYHDTISNFDSDEDQEEDINALKHIKKWQYYKSDPNNNRNNR